MILTNLCHRSDGTKARWGTLSHGPQTSCESAASRSRLRSGSFRAGSRSLHTNSSPSARARRRALWSSHDQVPLRRACGFDPDLHNRPAFHRYHQADLSGHSGGCSTAGGILQVRKRLFSRFVGDSWATSRAEKKPHEPHAAMTRNRTTRTPNPKRGWGGCDRRGARAWGENV